MKILLLADINSAHVEKWAVSLVRKGLEVCIFSLSSPTGTWHEQNRISLFNPARLDAKVFSAGLTAKLRYIGYAGKLKELIRVYNPDIVHAHYASSYGLLGALSGFHPLVISVWGSDIEAFSRIPLIGGPIMRFNFSRADSILSTSRAMVPAIRKHTGKDIRVTPFGIDSAIFFPEPEKKRGKNEIVIGTVKSLEPVYGIDRLLKAFALLKNRVSHQGMKLLIVGGGSQEQELRSLAENLGIIDCTIFQGKVPASEVPSWLNKMDIYVALSRRESFGVAVLEASSCGLPVVVSDTGGLPEVVGDKETGFVVPGGDIGKSANVLETLVLDENLRMETGRRGREFVRKNFSLADSVNLMINVYEGLV